MSTGTWVEVVEKSIERLIEGIDTLPDFKDLASEAGFSPFHFHKVFRAISGESPAEMSRRLRLERAAFEISVGERSVGEIAIDAGYEAVEAFTRSFQKAFGASPSSFRKEAQQIFWLECPNSVHFQPAGGPLGFVPVSYGDLTMDIRVDTAPDGAFIKKRVLGPYTELEKKWGGFFQELYSKGCIRGPVQSITVFHDDPDEVAAAELRADICVTHAGTDLEGSEVGQISQGKFAVATYTGHYDGLANAWAKVYGELLSAAGHKPRHANCFEMYLDDPTKTPPEKLRTEIWVPIE